MFEMKQPGQCELLASSEGSGSNFPSGKFPFGTVKH